MMIFGSLVAAVAAATMGASMPADTVRGVVFDSLSQRPLAGASVMAEPGGQSAMTDDRGQFVLVAPEKITRVTAFHLALGPDGLYVTGPTLSTFDVIYRVTFSGDVSVPRASV